MKASLKPYRLVFVIALAVPVINVMRPGLAWLAAANACDFLLEVLAVVPPIMLLMGLLDVWTPRNLVEDHLGPGAGLRGIALALLLGTAAAGPIYAAFPLAVALGRKGARVANIGIFLGAWATIKIPMILMESSFLGYRFALTRLALTLPGVIVAGYLLEWLVPHVSFDATNDPGTINP
jgi:uncharacterized membrane protein YraQ (UPF0718 family)